MEQHGREIRLVLVADTVGNRDRMCKELRDQIEAGFVSITLGGPTLLVER